MTDLYGKRRDLYKEKSNEQIESVQCLPNTIKMLRVVNGKHYFVDPVAHTSLDDSHSQFLVVNISSISCWKCDI